MMGWADDPMMWCSKARAGIQISGDVVRVRAYVVVSIATAFASCPPNKMARPTTEADQPATLLPVPSRSSDLGFRGEIALFADLFELFADIGFDVVEHFDCTGIRLDQIDRATAAEM
jgi:hypothetical protein